MMAENMPDFPVSSLLPKKETGVHSFLKKYPRCDGTGVVIAIFDSGVDPAAPGLEVCSNGRVKIIDRIDGSGAGDVDTSTVAKLSAAGTLLGISGRTLKVPTTWNNPSGEYHLGIKSAYSLYPSKLKERLVKERKEMVFDPQYKKRLESAMRKLQEEKQKLSTSISGPSSVSPTEDVESSLSENATLGDKSCCSDPTSTDIDDKPVSAAVSVAPASNDYSSFVEKLQKEEAEAEVALLNTANKKYQDLGPAYDCLVYHDGTCWRACIDTSERGDLSAGVHLGEYRVTHEWASLTPRDSFSVSINVHNEGNLLEIVGMCSSHGTHVASIAAACFPGDPDRNGVAPGAQIVSVTIGDNRIQGMETGTALSRAMAWVMDNSYYKVDIINMSYGEHSHFSSYGRLGELVSEVVNKYGVIWVASASNHGPALTTVGSPPDFLNDCILGIGAYVSPEMMRVEYSIMDKLPGTAYTWSSRGPTADGGFGVSVCAPGGAIASVPAFTNRTNQLLNGTSMASPHAAGCVALLLSGLKELELLYTPYTVRRAVQNTAHLLGHLDPFVQGHGLIQVEKAYDYLVQYSVKKGANELPPAEDNMQFLVECGGRGVKGIYLRNWLGDKSTDVSVSVEPVQFNESKSDDREKRRLCLDLIMTCDASFLSVPDCLHLSYTIRSFVVRINPASLQRGHVYFTVIKAFVAGEPEKGPLFEVPVTVVMPILELDHGYYFKSEPELFRSGCVRRTFIRVPEGATWASFSIKSNKSDQNQRMTLHAVQLLPQSSVLTFDHYKNFSCLYPEEQSMTAFSVHSGLTLEVCVARWWAAMHDTTIEYSLSFHGTRPSNEIFNIYTCNTVQRTDVTTMLRTEELCPQAVLKYHVQSLSPCESRIEVLGGARDTVPVNRPIYQLVLTYSFSVSKAAEVTPRCAPLSDFLYESAVESQLWMLFDSKKQHLGSGDAYCSKYSLKLEKGEYVLKMHVRHEKPEMLEKLQEISMCIHTKLSQEVKLDVYANYYSALVGGKKMSSQLAIAGSITPIFIQTPNLQDKVFKSLNLSPGHVLCGNITFTKDELAKKADNQLIRVVITEMGAGKKRASAHTESDFSGGTKREPKNYSDYVEAARDLMLNWITKLDHDSSDKLYKEFSEQLSGVSSSCALQLHLHRLLALDAHFNTPPYGASTTCGYSAADPAPRLESPQDEAGGDSGSNDLVVVETTESKAGCEKSDVLTWTQWKVAAQDLCARVQSLVDLPALLAFLGTKTDVRPDSAKVKTQMDKQKVALLEALAKVGLALAYPYVTPIINPHVAYAAMLSSPTSSLESVDLCVPPSPSDEELNELDTIATTILKLTEPSDAKVMPFFVSYYQVRQLYATAARLLVNSLNDSGKQQREAWLRLATLYALLNHPQLVADVIRSLPLRFPDKFVSF